MIAKGNERGRYRKPRYNLEEAEERLCDELGIKSSGKGFFVTLANEMNKFGLNPNLCATSIRVATGVNCQASELTGRDAYRQSIFQETLEGLITVLRTIAEFSEAEIETIRKAYEAHHGKPSTVKRDATLEKQTFAGLYIKLIAEKHGAQYGIETQTSNIRH